MEDESARKNVIRKEYGTITYSCISESIRAVQDFRAKAVWVKWDFESAFRHIPSSLLNSSLLGFHWEGAYYAEQLLPFGHRTALYIINHFAKVFHLVLNHELRKIGLLVRIIHYLDYFLLVLPLGSELPKYSDLFSELSVRVGLSIKASKNKEGSIASFAGIQIDTESMLIHLSPKKLIKAQHLVQNAIARRSATLLELQNITR